MIGNKVPFSLRVYPAQHRTAAERAHNAGLSISEYIGALIDRDAGNPSALDGRPGQTVLAIDNNT